MIVEYATMLSGEQVKRVHEASLEILDQVGLLVRNQKARKRFAEHGCRIDEDSRIVRLPPAVVEEFRAAIPPKFTYRGRDPACDRTVPDDAPVIATASSAPNIIDPVSGAERRATSADVACIAHLIDALPGFDVFSISTLAEDTPPGQVSLPRFYAALKNTRKPVRTAVADLAEAKRVLEMGALIAGSEAAYRERPFITFGHCPIVSPLVMDVDSTEMAMHYAEHDIPSYGTIAPIAGISAPLSLSGMLAMTNAEWLAMAALVQMSRPGTPMLHIFLPVVADMRTGAYAPGGIETGIVGMALAQMARFYGVPSGGYMGQTNAKLSDAQAGYEKSMNPLAGLLGGIDVMVMGGLLDALMTFDYGQAAIDNEIALMLKRLARGFEFSEDNLALSEIEEVGPGGMFIDHPRTLERMRSTGFLPEIADRNSRETWAEQGSSDAHARAMVRVREIITGDNPSLLAPEVDRRIRAEFPDMVAGDSRPPEGWQRIAPAPGGRRQGRRRRRGP